MDCIYCVDGQCKREVGGKRRACGSCTYGDAICRLSECPWSVPDDGFNTRQSSLEKRAAWADVAAKAWAIVDTGDIEILREDGDEVEALVMSYEVQFMINPVDGKPFPVTDGGPYDVILSKRSWESSSNVGGWLQGFLCDCIWGQYHSGSPDDPGRFSGRLCFVPGTKIMMADGTFKNIEDVKVGDMVMAKDAPHRVMRTYERPYNGPVTTIRTAGHVFPITMTDNHPLLSNPELDNWLEGHKAKNISNPASCGYRLLHDISCWDGKRDAGACAVGDLTLSSVPMKEEYKEFDIVDMFDDIEDDADGKAVHPCDGNGRQSSYVLQDYGRLNRIVPMNDDLAYVVGWYLAEGSVEGHSGIDIVRWSLNKDETEVVQKLTDCLKRLGCGNVRVQDYSYRGAIAVLVSSRPLARLLTYLCGSRSTQKHLAPEIMSAPIEWQRHFLEAYTDGDGHRKGNGYSISTASEMLALQIPVIVERVYGSPAGVHTNLNSPGPQARAKGKNRLEDGTPIYHIDYGMKYVQKRYVVDDNHYATRITDVQHGLYEGPVYNIEVGVEHIYNANGVLVHNCSHSAAVVFALNIRARKDFMNDRTAGVFDIDNALPMLHCINCGSTVDVDLSNGLCLECNASRTFDNYIASIYCNDPVADRWLDINADPDIINEITNAHTVQSIDSNAMVASWNGLKVLFTPKDSD